MNSEYKLFIEVELNQAKLDSKTHLLLNLELDQVNVPQVENPEDADFIIVHSDEKLTLFDSDLGLVLEHPLYTKSFPRRLKTLNKSEPLIKAISKLKSDQRIADFTFGLGSDSLAMASRGFDIIAFERSPILYVLNKIALKVGPSIGFPFCDKIQYLFADARDACREWKSRGNFRGIEPPEIIYLDPMFTESKRKALPGKEMQILKHLVGEDLDKDDLFELALQVCKNRVLYKRPLHAAQFSNGPQHVFKGKSHKIEMYLRN